MPSLEREPMSTSRRSRGNNVDDRIDLKCQEFQRSITSLIGKIQKSRAVSDEDVAQCHCLVRHANHILCTLAAKKASLSRALVAFRDASAQYVEQFASLEPGREDARRRLLRRWFAAYLRLRDGFVLLESGERRHPRDGEDARGVDVSQSEFRSRLGDAYHADGVTRKFSSANGYTGAGFDEFNDADVGVKRRLLDVLARMSGKKRASMLQRTFEKDGHSAQIWESEIDGLNDTSGLRRDLNAIRDDFVGVMNKHLRKKGSPNLLKLVTDDKAERLTLGLLDIARAGDAFTLHEAGGSLPFGKNLQDWKEKFGLAQHPPTAGSSTRRPPCKGVNPKPKKRRKVILEDSSSEEEEGDVRRAHPSEKQQPAPPISNNDGINDDDGVLIYVRKPTDVRSAKTRSNDAQSTSINEMKQQHGVDKARLEQGREHLEGEQLRAKMAADDEDLREEFLGSTGGGGSGLRNHIPLLKACLDGKTELQRNEWYATKDNYLLWEGQNSWARWEESLAGWKDCFQGLLRTRRELDEDSLDNSSDRAYIVRDSFREACINLGNDCMEVNELFFSRLQNSQQTMLNRSNPQFAQRSSLDESMSNVCYSCLRFAEETFKTALSLVLEQERCQDHSLKTIGRQWEKGQHYLLRGRAHHNIGRASYELAQYHKTTSRQQGWQKSKHLILRARKESDNAVQRAKALRRNAVLIRGHTDAQDASTQNKCSWMAEGVVHFLEAIKLELLSSRLQIDCLCKLDRMKDAEERFDGFFGSVEIADIVQCAGAEGVTHLEIAETIDDTYYFAMKVAESLTQSLERMAKKKGLDALTGDKLLQIACIAMKRAASISDQLLSFDVKHNLEYEKSHILTKAEIENEEAELMQWWETAKLQAKRKMSDFVESAHANNAVRSALPRTEMGEFNCAPSHTRARPRRIFIQDGRPLHDRSTVSRTRGVKKKNTEAEARASEEFSSEFGSGCNISGTGGRSTRPIFLGDNAAVVYRKWGDEILEEHERKRTCPPLPDGLSIDVRHALDKKLKGILPSGNGILT